MAAFLLLAINVLFFFLNLRPRCSLRLMCPASQLARLGHGCHGMRKTYLIYVWGECLERQCKSPAPPALAFCHWRFEVCCLTAEECPWLQRAAGGHLRRYRACPGARGAAARRSQADFEGHLRGLAFSRHG